MPLDPRAKRLLDLLAAARGPGPAPDASPAARRAALDQLADLAAGPAPPLAEVRDLSIPGPGGPLPLRIYDPAPGESGGGVLFLHGGGWTAGSLATHDTLCRTLALHADCKLVAVDYRRPPEHPRPAAADDGLCALAWMAGHGGASFGVDPARLCVAGDSAGAHVAVEVALAARDQGVASPALQLLLCPILDPAGALPSRTAFARGYFIDPNTFAYDRQGYFGAHAATASVLDRGDLAGLPPTLIHAAEFDPFRDEALAFADRLAAAAVETRATVHPGLVHYFYALTGAVPAGRPIVEAIGREIGQVLA
jgi:acetyl esterase